MKLTLNLNYYLYLIGTLALLLAPLSASASDSVECDTTCDSGKTLTSFLDGNSVTCACVAEAQMEPNVADDTVTEGPVNQDTE